MLASCVAWKWKFYGWKTVKKKRNSVELEASLAPAEAEVGALTKEDQNIPFFVYFIQIGNFLLQSVLFVSDEMLSNYCSLTMPHSTGIYAFKYNIKNVQRMGQRTLNTCTWKMYYIYTMCR